VKILAVRGWFYAWLRRSGFKAEPSGMWEVFFRVVRQDGYIGFILIIILWLSFKCFTALKTREAFGNFGVEFRPAFMDRIAGMSYSAPY
jgi:hypothetical protein